jgi:hypothetical protein
MWSPRSQSSSSCFLSGSSGTSRRTPSPLASQPTRPERSWPSPFSTAPLGRLFLPSPYKRHPSVGLTDGRPKTLQTNPCRVFLKDTTCSALTGLHYWLPEPRAQRARDLPFVREAAPSLSGLSLRVRGLHPKRKVSGAASLFPIARQRADSWTNSGAEVRGLVRTGSRVRTRGGAAAQEQPDRDGATWSGHVKIAPALPRGKAGTFKVRPCSPGVALA